MYITIKTAEMIAACNWQPVKAFDIITTIIFIVIKKSVSGNTCW